MANMIKRSEVNRIMKESDKFIRSFGYIMPPFAYWSPSEFKSRKAEAQKIIDSNLGWDITDYGLNEFDKTGLFLFTVRNGNNADLSKGRGMLYAEKAMISRDKQYSPMHRHNLKAEDIINRGGGTLVIELFGDTDGKCDRSKGVTVYTDGLKRVLPAYPDEAYAQGRQGSVDVIVTVATLLASATAPNSRAIASIQSSRTALNRLEKRA